MGGKVGKDWVKVRIILFLLIIKRIEKYEGVEKLEKELKKKVENRNEENKERGRGDNEEEERGEERN